ncbi:MAG: ribonuclease HII [Dehalococcoidia bacterium]|nr:ribonuclease HII [Dehalococcoidia bacterium]MSQ17239.1 ribonuclease HII [Dehalococcoidia bacterium]
MPDLSLERRLHQAGVTLVAGVDEAGRGPLAGPVAAAAVILPPDLSGDEPWLALVDDSKRLSAAQRDRAITLVQAHALAVAVCLVGPEQIDRIGIGQATLQAMLQAVSELAVPPQHLLLDYVPLRRCHLPFDLIVRGDSLSYSIAAASIVAKVTRDRWMLQADAQFPGYAFAQHKGYPTARHLSCLQALGPCAIHRRSFAPVRQVCHALPEPVTPPPALTQQQHA